MNILYYGFDGAPADVLVGYIFLGVLVFLTAIFIIEAVGKEWIGAVFFGIVAFALFFLVYNAFTDTRTPIVKVTLDPNISYVEINKDYKLIKQEGKIYTFKVLNTTNEEWEAIVEENK